MHVVITGANRGIGLALTQACCARGDTVTALVRKTSKALAATGARVLEGVDVTDSQCLESLAERVQEPVDLLINNAGMLVADNLSRMPWKDIERQLAVNSLGPLRVTYALLTLLQQGGTVALITSHMGSVADNTSGAYYGYRMSKAALNAAGKSLSIDLAPMGVAVAILHPGFVQTDMVNHAGDISPKHAAAGLLARIAETTPENSGEFWHANGEPLPW